MKHVQRWLPVWFASMGAWPLVPWEGHGTGPMFVVDMALHAGGLTFALFALYDAAKALVVTLKEINHGNR